MQARKVIDDIGGPRVLALALGEIRLDAPKAGAVRRWSERNTIPYRWRNAVYLVARSRRMRITREDVGLDA